MSCKTKDFLKKDISQTKGAIIEDFTLELFKEIKNLIGKHGLEKLEEMVQN